MASLISKSLLLIFSFSLMVCLSYSRGSPGDFSTLRNDLDKFTSEEDILKLFKAWEKEYKKHYETHEEELKRYEIFKTNLNFIVGSNAKRSSAIQARLGLNEFADLTYEEFGKTHFGELPLERSIIEPKMGESKTKQSSIDRCPNAPASLDWRDFGVVTKVKDQDGCQSCWAISAAGAIESINALVTGNLVSLSAQQLVSCDPHSSGCNGGRAYRAFEYVINNGGIAADSIYPYTASNGTCDHKLESFKTATIDGYGWVPIRSDDALLCAVARQPISISVQKSPYLQFYQNGIVDETWCTIDDPCAVTSHCMLIVGYGSSYGEDYWIVKNQWGPNWGDHDGYLFIKRNTGHDFGVCNINCVPVYPIKHPSGKLDAAIR